MSHLIYYCIILKIPFYFVWWNDLITVYKHYKLQFPWLSLAQTTYYMVNLSSVLKSMENPVSVSSVLSCLNLFES